MTIEEAMERVRTIAIPGLLAAPEQTGLSRCSITNPGALAADLRLILDEVERLRGEVEAVYPVVPDDVTKVTLAVLDVVASGQKVLSAGGAKSTAELITKLCTERDQYRDAMETYSGSLIKATQSQVAAEARVKALEGALRRTDAIAGGSPFQPETIQGFRHDMKRIVTLARAALAQGETET